MTEQSSWSYENTTAIILLAIGFIVYLPLTIYFAYPVQHAKDSLVFQKRQSVLTLYAVYALCLNIVFTSVLSPMLSHVGPFDSSHLDWLVLIVSILQLCTLQFFYSTLFIRLWLFYYNIRYNMMSGNDWIAIIDTSYDAEKSWFARVHNTLGNRSLLIKINWIVNILYLVTDASLSLINEDYAAIFSSIYLSLTILGFCVFASIIYCKLRKVKYFDDLHILDEFQAFYKVLMAFILVVFIYALVSSLVLFPSFPDDHALLLFISVTFIGQTLSIFNISVVYVMSRWIFNQLRDDVTLQSQYGEALRQASFFLQSVQAVSDSERDAGFEDTQPNESTAAIATGLTLLQVLQKQEYLLTFMQHLSHEFSMECLLSLIEFVQFRALQDVDTAMTNTSLAISDVKLTSNAPKSSIVFNKEYDNETKARKLYEKYIATGSDYEINISAKDRNALTRRFEGESFGKAVDFDKCIEDMISLLRYSFARFKNKNDYNKMERFASISD